ncbi:hypothetical protein LR48_Vigan03g286500 [Vigna angularis]|uniref:Uncharacterized protein n=1 Tax=Phaseolus angularis TaxID=3914 RepID=A0A0L9U9S5_PHAAN|nr:hypothetical protein LR48_Vigan03g286500 [Vigna angularis]
MCPHSQWEKVAKGYGTRSMFPFDHKILDIRTSGSTLENFEVSVIESVGNISADFRCSSWSWLWFWVVHKLVLTEDGSVDTSTAQFVEWAIRILPVIMILQPQLKSPTLSPCKSSAAEGSNRSAM